MPAIATQFTISAEGIKERKGICQVPKSVWDYAITEFPANSITGNFQVGIPDDPVLANILEQEKIPVKMENVDYFSMYPIKEEDQLKYLGCLMFED